MPKPVIEVHLRHVLKDTVCKEIAANGADCDLNHLDVGEMQDISNTFEGTTFTGDVSSWQVGAMRDMRRLFAKCPFSGDLSQWDVNPRSLIEGMLSADFRGTLPALANEPEHERVAAYIDMFGSVDNYDQYLAAKPFGDLHVAYLADTPYNPPWLNHDALLRVNDARALAVGLGLDRKALCTLIDTVYHNFTQGIAPEHLSFEFENGI